MSTDKIYKIYSFAVVLYTLKSTVRDYYSNLTLSLDELQDTLTVQ